MDRILGIILCHSGVELMKRGSIDSVRLGIPPMIQSVFL
jgi:hypothetical protein